MYKPYRELEQGELSDNNHKDGHEHEDGYEHEDGHKDGHEHGHEHEDKSNHRKYKHKHFHTIKEHIHELNEQNSKEIQSIPSLNVLLIIDGILIEEHYGNYSGYLYDIWKLIRSNLEKNNPGIKIQEHYVKEENENEEMIHKWIEEHKTDIVVDAFARSSKREHFLSFSYPIISSKIGIIYEKKHTNLSYMKHILDVFGKPFGLFLMIGIVMGFLLYIFDPKRNKRIHIPKNKSLLHSVSTVMSSLFGESGALYDAADLKVSQQSILFLIMIITLIFNMYLQAVVVDEVLDYKTNVYSFNDLKALKLISKKDDAAHYYLKRYNINTDVTEDNVTNDELIEYFRRYKHIYDGIIVEYFDANEILTKHPNLMVDYFRNVPFSIGYSKQMPETVKDHINKIIIELDDSGSIFKICRSYFTDDKNNICLL